MFINKISIDGYRGFGDNQDLNVATPKEALGSGLTVIVGPNNSGKSTVIEAFKAVSLLGQAPSFATGKRNKESGDRVEIKLITETGDSITLKSIVPGSSETEFIEPKIKRDQFKIFVIKSRRTFNPYFDKAIWDRDQFIQNDSINNSGRGTTYERFQYRLFHIQKEPQAFNKVLEKVLYPIPTWTIDQHDTGQHFLKFNYNGNYHDSDGAGEGLLSLFTIIDALYDSKPGEIIVIDEPELSLHPSLQRNLLDLLLEYSKDRQIVVSTHSPYFISWESIINGGEIARIVKEGSKSKIYKLKPDFTKKIKGLMANLNNPHILGLDAKEIFFLNDNVVVVEGQEDVVFYKRLLRILQLELKGSFYGWGIGGADNLELILNILKSLGFKKVACILDNNMAELKDRISKKFKYYSFHTIPTNDIRDKKAVPEKKPIEGLISSCGTKMNEKYADQTIKIVKDINEYYQM
ncbi:MAG: ATP-binding protein [Cyclobacteriaceae bacterium]|nr:ATP-binding protein [Cyclobacteriaceae bacterium]